MSPVDRQDVREMFDGSDRVWGKEICTRLGDEELGTPVIYRNAGNRKIEKKYSREPGGEDENVRIVTEEDDRLLGVVLPSGGGDNEFVYISAGSEGGFVFKTTRSDLLVVFNGYDPKRLGSASFNNFIGTVGYETGNATNIIFKEEDARYPEVVEQAVTKARSKQAEERRKRGEVRKSLFEKLFGSG